jgi:hypothetical protein
LPELLFAFPELLIDALEALLTARHQTVKAVLQDLLPLSQLVASLRKEHGLLPAFIVQELHHLLDL